MEEGESMQGRKRKGESTGTEAALMEERGSHNGGKREGGLF